MLCLASQLIRTRRFSSDAVSHCPKSACGLPKTIRILPLPFIQMTAQLRHPTWQDLRHGLTIVRSHDPRGYREVWERYEERRLYKEPFLLLQSLLISSHQHTDRRTQHNSIFTLLNPLYETSSTNHLSSKWCPSRQSSPSP